MTNFRFHTLQINDKNDKLACQNDNVKKMTHLKIFSRVDVQRIILLVVGKSYEITLSLYE